MSQTRTIGRYKLKSYASVQEPRQYAALVTHRDTGDQWMLALSVDSLDACKDALEKPLQFPKES